MSQLNPERIIELKNRSAGLDAGIVIDTLRNGSACGGLRILPDVDLEETKLLARAMTLKFGFILNSSVGGAKSFIKIPRNCTNEKKCELIRQFATQASQIIKNGVYFPHMDMNCSNEDVNLIYETLKMKMPQMGDSSYYTALTIFSCIAVAAEYQKLNLNELSLVISGFGNVATYLAEEIKNTGIKIIGVSNTKGAIYRENGLDINKLIELRKEHGSNFLGYYLKNDQEFKFLSNKELIAKKCDILVPAARPYSINRKNVSKIKARIISPAANFAYDDYSIGYLHKKGIISFPDFVSSCGGVYGTSLNLKGVSQNGSRKIILKYFTQAIKKLLIKSSQANKSIHELAEEMVVRNLETKNRKNGNEKYNLLNDLKILIRATIKLGPSFFTNPIYQFLERGRLSKLI